MDFTDVIDRKTYKTKYTGGKFCQRKQRPQTQVN